VATVEGRVRAGEFARYSAARDWSMACDKARTSIRVITLDTSVDRRRAFTQMARDIKLDWAFFPAHTSLTEPLRYGERAAVAPFLQPRLDAIRAISRSGSGCQIRTLIRQ